MNIMSKISNEWLGATDNQKTGFNRTPKDFKWWCSDAIKQRKKEMELEKSKNNLITNKISNHEKIKNTMD